MKTPLHSWLAFVLTGCLSGLAAVTVPATASASEPVVFEDFEGSDWGDWTTTGTAFGPGPVSEGDNGSTITGIKPVGNRFVHSLVCAMNDATATGTLTSPAFTVSHDFIHFLIGGGSQSIYERVRLLDAVDGSQLKIATGDNSHLMRQVAWNVSTLTGRSVKIQISDGNATGWKHISCDHIVFSDEAAISIPGYLSSEVWTGISAFKVSDLVENDKFYGAPDEENRATSVFTDIDKYSGGRLRGYITAPDTGKYTFWVSSSTSAELWLSADQTKYRKNRIASNGGVPWDSTNFWDLFSSQMSEEVELVAGEKYYIEILSQQHHSASQHIRFAWARPGAEREPVPSEFLSTYAREAEDMDDDYLPDAWETQNGLDPADNGLIDRARQGERGDFDLDGLSNREEYVYGTDPANPDTDGDGLLDSAEIRSYNTDPTVSDSPSESLVGIIDLTTFTASEPWTLTSQGLIPPTFRGSISWNFTVPGDGYWSLNVATSLLGDLYLYETVDVGVAIDGHSMGRSTLVYGRDRDALLRILTPYLAAGSHTVALDIDNKSARRTVSIRSIEVLQPQGADLDADGIPDWIYSQLVGSNALFPYQPLSRTSPAFLEGNARMRSSATLNGAPVLAGTDVTHWYADLSLDPVSPTSFALSLEQGLTNMGSIDWRETNVLDSETLVIRKNDSLKLVAKPATGTTGQSFTLSSTPVNWALDPAATASQSTTEYGGGASRAIDGATGGIHPSDPITFTKNQVGSWWKVNLGADRRITKVRLWNRVGSTQNRLSNYRVSVIDSEGITAAYQDFHTDGTYTGRSETWQLAAPVSGKTVKVEFLGPNSVGTYVLSLAEVEVFGEGIDETLASDTGQFTCQFADAGTKTVTATHSSGSTGTLTVIVKQAEFSETPRDLVANSPGILEFPLSVVDADLHFDGGTSAFVKNPATLSGNLLSLQISPKNYGNHNMLARLHEGGPVLGVQPLNFVGFSGAIENDLISSYRSNEYPGYIIITNPILVTDLPEGGTVVVTIFRAGVTFLDGTKTLTLSVGDFINGIYTLEFLFPENLSGGNCHYIDVYDRDGNYIGSR